MVTLLICFFTAGSQHHKRLKESARKSLGELVDVVFDSYKFFITRAYRRTRECEETRRQLEELRDEMVRWFTERNLPVF